MLKKLRLIKKNSQGFYERVGQNLEFDPELDSHILQNFMLKTMEISKDAIRNNPQKERSFEAVTVSVSHRGIERITQEINELLKRITIISNDPIETADRVYQFNCQFFPLTTIRD